MPSPPVFTDSGKPEGSTESTEEYCGGEEGRRGVLRRGTEKTAARSDAIFSVPVNN